MVCAQYLCKPVLLGFVFLNKNWLQRERGADSLAGLGESLASLRRCRESDGLVGNNGNVDLTPDIMEARGACAVLFSGP